MVFGNGDETGMWLRVVSERERERDRQTDRQTDRKTDEI